VQGTAYDQNCGNMLIVCNKTDALADELAGISPKNMVKKRLEVLPALLLGRVYAASPPPGGSLYRLGDMPTCPAHMSCLCLAPSNTPTHTHAHPRTQHRRR